MMTPVQEIQFSSRPGSSGSSGSVASTGVLGTAADAGLDATAVPPLPVEVERKEVEEGIRRGVMGTPAGTGSATGTPSASVCSINMVAITRR